MNAQRKRPTNRTHLIKLITQASESDSSAAQLSKSLATIAICQMLASINTVEGYAGMVKGGTAMKLRLGRAGARASADVDVVRSIEKAKFEERLIEALRVGWQGFTGRLKILDPANPKNIPKEYIMQPYKISVLYEGKEWQSVVLDLGTEEIGDTEEYDLALADSLKRELEQLGFSEIALIPVIALQHQIAQKIHAATQEGSERAHDLLDLQLLINSESDLKLIREICVRLFKYRKSTTWPPTFKLNLGWEDLYSAHQEGLPVLGSASEAVEWGNQLVQLIEDSN
jgi:hypothetical protein